MDNERVCLDSTVRIGYLRRHQPEAMLVRDLVQHRPCCVASITVYEVLFGGERRGKTLDEDVLLGLLQVLPFDDACARKAAKLHADLIRMNADIGVKDVLIAATCIHHNVLLLTTNERHFRRVAALQLLPMDAA